MKRYFRRDNLTGQVAEITKGNYDTIRSLNVKTLTVWAEEQVEVVETKKRKRIQEAEAVDTAEAVETAEAAEIVDNTDAADAIKSVESAESAEAVETVDNTDTSETAEIVSFSEYTINKLKERPIVIKNEADRAIVEELKKKMRMW